jgi:hypothetical protein
VSQPCAFFNSTVPDQLLDVIACLVANGVARQEAQDTLLIGFNLCVHDESCFGKSGVLPKAVV